MAGIRPTAVGAAQQMLVFLASHGLPAAMLLANWRIQLVILGHLSLLLMELVLADSRCPCISSGESNLRAFQRLFVAAFVVTSTRFRQFVVRIQQQAPRRAEQQSAGFPSTGLVLRAQTPIGCIGSS